MAHAESFPEGRDISTRTGSGAEFLHSEEIETSGETSLDSFYS